MVAVLHNTAGDFDREPGSLRYSSATTSVWDTLVIVASKSPRAYFEQSPLLTLIMQSHDNLVGSEYSFIIFRPHRQV